jgi:hypothetical protein
MVGLTLLGVFVIVLIFITFYIYNLLSLTISERQSFPQLRCFSGSDLLENKWALIPIL